VLQLKKCVWALRADALKEHSAVVVKKEFWLRKAFNQLRKAFNCLLNKAL